MLQNIRDKSQGWIAKAIIGVIVLLLALTGFDAIIRATSHAQSAAEVNGEEITQNELGQAVEMQRRQLLQQLGPNFDASKLDDNLLRDSALRGLIERRLLLQDAREGGLSLSEATLDQIIVNTPEFQQDGKFSTERFDQVIRQMGYGRLQFRQMLRDELLIGQLRAGIAGSAFVSEPQVRAFAELERQTRDFATLKIAADTSTVSVSDDEVKAHYEEHKAEFMTPEQVVVNYLELKKSALFDKATASDEQLQALYQQEVGNLAEQRRAAHILVEVNDKTSDEQAKAKIESIKKRLDAGEDFATLAKENSDDPGSARQGGDLGFAGRGVYEQPFEDALYALDKGQVSEPVKTSYGWHLIKLLDVQAPEVPTFESLRSKLVQEVKSQQVEQLFVEQTKQLEDSAYEASDLSQPAQDLGLQVQTSEPFGRSGGAGLAANPKVVEAAFSQEVLEDGANSTAIELDPDTIVVLRVKEHRQPEQMPLESVATQIREHLIATRAAEQASAEGERLLASLKDASASNAEAAKGRHWEPVEAASRNQEGVDPQVLQEVFRMPHPAAGDKPVYAGVALSSGDYVLIRLNGVGQPQQALTDEELSNYRRFLSSRAGQEAFDAYRRELQAKADIERY